MLGIRNDRSVNINSADWTAPVGDTVHSNGGSFGRTLNSGYGLGVGDLAAESTATWKGDNTGASAAMLVFTVPDMCYLPAQAGRTIVDLTPYEFIRSDKTEDAATHGPFAVDLPAGVYDVILHSWDDHEKKSKQDQPNESWFLQLWNSDPVNFQNTSPISDLPDDDNFITEVVDEDLEITEDVALVQAFHSAYEDKNPNSIYPICVAFDEVVEEGEVLGETQVDVPTGSVDAGTIDESISVLAVIGLVASIAATGFGVTRLFRRTQ